MHEHLVLELRWGRKHWRKEGKAGMIFFMMRRNWNAKLPLPIGLALSFLAWGLA